MKLTDIQATVLKTIEENTSTERYISIDALENSLREKNANIGRQELFTILSSLRTDGRLEFTGAAEEFVFTLQKKDEAVMQD